jgi:hypothetical protein
MHSFYPSPPGRLTELSPDLIDPEIEQQTAQSRVMHERCVNRKARQIA